ncbi:hypothetical protein BU24DRAFT_32897 [Aaosphaeria arxii CBS 175.79]|uniref:Uncharacterized protein n=1 Tax=Aaosphaeria arxii CBS 175.79 TaxID=1450172 RepID=A0A6A5Y927_9PLEO|nr:uncharacterized protein BU24DRAFT_32897 [Aaosphaeria arxii CBS 175.79]KAF2021928.1 hypothetical protein BU24DRAFT_32897 [Aaosphaeria arxii CBS 175.79]
MRTIVRPRIVVHDTKKGTLARLLLYLSAGIARPFFDCNSSLIVKASLLRWTWTDINMRWINQLKTLSLSARTSDHFYTHSLILQPKTTNKHHQNEGPNATRSHRRCPVHCPTWSHRRRPVHRSARRHRWCSMHRPARCHRRCTMYRSEGRHRRCSVHRSTPVDALS